MGRFIALAFVVSTMAFLAAQEPAPKKDPPKKAEPKKDAPAEPADDEDVDVHKTAERIVDNAQKVGDRLKDKDPGSETRKLQDEILKDLDALLKKKQLPPPPMPPMDNDNTPPPPNGDGSSPPPKGGNGDGSGAQPKSPMGSGSSGQANGGGSKGSSRQQRRERRSGTRPSGGSQSPMGKSGGNEPQAARPEPKEGPMGDPKDRNAMGKNTEVGKISPKRQNDKLADLYKDVWGQLPDRMRQEMDLYYREQFMPRYSELLRQYYAALAEQRKKEDKR